MRDPRLDKLADVLVGYSTRVKPGDLVTIEGEAVSLPLVEALYERVLAAGGHPVWVARSEALYELLMERAAPEQLTYVSPLDTHRVETVDVRLTMWSEMNTRSMSRMDPNRVALQQSSRRPVMKRFMERLAAQEMRWCGTQYPTYASAQDAEMSLPQYEEFVFRAGLLHLPDPASAWRAVHERQERVREYLQGKKEVRFRTPARDGHDGTDLVVNVDGGTWINCAGTENFPDGEVFTGPRGVDGHVNYTFPAVYNGVEVHGVRLAFKGGRVVEASAQKNEEYLVKMLDQDDGARNMGEIAVGTNYAIKEFTRNTLFDEKIGGTFHAAVGAGYPESGNNNESALHWDMVCDLRRGGTIEGDGEVFSRDGAFLRGGWPAAGA